MRAGRLRIMFVVPFPPRLGATHGGAKAIGELALRSAERHDIGLVYLRHRDEPGPEDRLLERIELAEEIPRPDEPTGRAHLARALRRRLRLLAGTPLWVSELSSPSATERIRAVAAEWQPDVVRLEYPVSAALLPSPRGRPAILVDYDPMLMHARSGTGARERAELGLDRRAWRRFDARSRSEVDAVSVLTERDRLAVTAAGGARLVVRIPLGIEPLPALDPRGTDHSLLFVGNLNHPANREAVAHLVGEIVPAIRAREPGAVLTVVGEPRAGDTRAVETPGVRYAGLVDDVRPYLDAAAVVLAPLRTGSGMRVKVLEALSAGKAVVAYPLALAGIDAEPGRDVVAAGNAQEFAAAVLQLLGDPGRRIEIARAARDWARANVGWDKSLDAWDDLYDRLLEHRAD
jgi:glycosyltransferase involved in cell wall biosynthesis